MRTLNSLRQPRHLGLGLGLIVSCSVALAACAGSGQKAKVAATARSGEPTFAAAMVGPLTKETPLQIVSLFSYEAGEALISPATELAAFVADQRTSGDFGKDPLRLLLLDSPPAAVKCKQLLYIALGPRAEFSLDRVRALGATAMRETLRLGVEQMAFAPVVRDQGVTKFAADEVAVAFVDGALGEWDTERRASPQTPLHLKDVTYEAGPTFIEAVKNALPRGVAAAHARQEAGTPGSQ